MIVGTQQNIQSLCKVKDLKAEDTLEAMQLPEHRRVLHLRPQTIEGQSHIRTLSSLLLK